MFHYYKIILIIVAVALPYSIFAYNNRFDKALHTAKRAIMAIIIGWVFLLLSRFIVDQIDLWLAKTPEEVQQICDGDGAKNVAVLFMGWIVPGIVVLISWIFHKIINLIKGKICPNKGMQTDAAEPRG